MTGPGSPAAERERIFEEFYQLDNPERDRSQGLGLGLAIVLRAVESHAGHIELLDRTGGGLTVLVRLPRDRR